MTPKRPKQLKWIGDMLPDGRPARHLEGYGIHARDLTPDETDELTQEQLTIARNSGLYREVAQTAEKRTRHADAPEPTKPEPAADDAETAAEPATEGEDS